MKIKTVVVGVIGSFLLGLPAHSFSADSGPLTRPAPQTRPGPVSTWKVGTPIVTYFAGPPMSEAVATQMAKGGFNVVWCGWKDLGLLEHHGLRGMVHDPALKPDSLDTPAGLAKLNTLIGRVKSKAAFYSYYITDEPGAKQFEGLGKLVAHLRERDPSHMAYINLLPTYANNQQLGTPGNQVAAYNEYLKEFVDDVKPALLSWDHYQFFKNGDHTGYFLNLDMVRKKSLETGVPFLNIIQAASWEPHVRVPNGDETRYLVYTSAAYGAQGISYYVYTASKHEGGIAKADGTPTPIYETLKTLNREFVAVARQLQSMRSLGVYHTTMKESGCVPLPEDGAFQVDWSATELNARGLLLGYFNAAGSNDAKDADKPTAAMVVNLDYKAEAKPTIMGPGKLEIFDATTGKWEPADANKAVLTLPPGGGKLIRVAKPATATNDRKPGALPVSH